MNEFERKLQRQLFRDVPPRWRREIVPCEATSYVTAWSWRDWFWPSPQAWATLAASWLLLALCNNSTGRRWNVSQDDFAQRNSVPVASLLAFQSHERLVLDSGLPR